LPTPAPPPHWYLIANPTSGRGRGARFAREFAARLAQRGVRVDTALTEAPMHAASLARDALRAGYRHVAALGGDGTANEVVNGLASQDEVALADVSIGMVPVGTGNDWARSLALPRRPADLAGLLAAGRTIECDLGRIEYSIGGARAQRWFVNVAGAGFDAFVIRRLGSRKPSRWAYLVELLRSARHFDAPAITVGGDGVDATRRALVVFAGLGRYCGGGMQVAPQARIDDGRLDVTLVSDMTGVQLLRELPRLFNGTVPESAFVDCWSTPSLRIDADAPTGVEADGELLGELPARIETLPRRLRVVAPGTR